MPNHDDFYRVRHVQPDAPVEVIEARDAGTIQTAMHCAFCGTPHSVRAAQRPDARCATCRSPLHAVAKLEVPESTDPRRAVERIDRRMPVNLEVSWPHRLPLIAMSENLSIHGMGLIVPARLATGTRMKIACEFCDAVGEVIYIGPRTSLRPAAWRMGIRFLTIEVHCPRGGLVSIRA